LYRDSGSFYIYKTKNFISKSILKNTYYDVPKSFSVDIDTIEDFNLAKLIAKGMGLNG
jgi:CMP-N-acetylneuraminic acid synthetase